LQHRLPATLPFFLHICILQENRATVKTAVPLILRSGLKFGLKAGSNEASGIIGAEAAAAAAWEQDC